MSVRVRFAPSPTGPLHIGGVRTALYNYLFAKKNNGVFILRIEDTDQSRYVEGAEDYIIESLNWVGMSPDEGVGVGGDVGPYRQSERREIYADHVSKLIENGSAYYAFDTPAELEAMREQMRGEGVHSPKYDHSMRMKMRNSLTLSKEELSGLLEENAPYTVRLNIPKDEKVVFVDRVRGEIVISTNELDDKVLMKADGLPTYHFANVVDDHLMGITHVIRGEEWLPSTAHHVLLYRAFGWEDTMPEFAHLPLILKPSGKGKLSKRDGAKFGFPVFPLEWPDPEGDFEGFREFGFVPEALMNFLAFLGWNPGTEQELYSEEELVRDFSIDKIIKAGARFDYDKALWFNSQHILTMEPTALNTMAASLINTAGHEASDEFVAAYVSLYKDRVKLLDELVDGAAVYLNEPSNYEEAFVRKKWSEDLKHHFGALEKLLNALDSFTAEPMEEAIKSYIKEHGLNFGAVFQLMRTAISGSPKGPDLYAMLELLGREKVVARMESCIDIFDAIQLKANGE